MNRIIATYRWIAILLVTVLLTGCVSGTAQIQVHKNGSADVKIKLGVDQQAKKYLANINPFASVQLILQNNGFKVKEYDNKADFGFEASRHYKSIQQLQVQTTAQAEPVSGDNEAGANKMISFTNEEDKGLFFTTHRIESTIDFSNLYDDFLRTFGHHFGASNAAAEFVATELSEKIQFKLKVSLPVKATKTNAEKVTNHKKTLEWQINPVKKNTIMLQVKVPNVRNMLIAGGLLLVVLCIGVYLWIKRRKTNQQ